MMKYITLYEDYIVEDEDVIPIPDIHKLGKDTIIKYFEKWWNNVNIHGIRGGSRILDLKTLKDIIPEFTKYFNDLNAPNKPKQKKGISDEVHAKKMDEYKERKDAYDKHKAKEQEVADILKEYLKNQKKEEVRSNYLRILAIVGTGLIIIGAMGGALMSLRGFMIAATKHKNKKKTGDDKLTPKQEENLHKILLLSKIMVVIGGVGGALRSLKFLIKIWQDHNAFADEHGYLGDLGESDKFEQTTINLYKLMSNSKQLTNIVDKFSMVKGIHFVMQSITQKITSLDEDLLIEVAKMSELINKNFSNGEQKEIMKLGNFTMSTVRENLEPINEYNSSDVEDYYNLAIGIIGQEKIDSMIDKVWDTNVDKTINFIEKTKDNNTAIIKLAEFKKNVDMKLDYHEKQALLKLASKLS